MAFPDFTGCKSLMGELMQDTGTNLGISDAIRSDLFNLVYSAHKAKSEPRIMTVASSGNWGVTVSGTTAILSTPIDWVKILKVFREALATDILVGPQLEQTSVAQIQYLQQTYTTRAAPTKYALERVNTQAAQAPRYWRMRLWPICDAAYFFSSQVIAEPVALSSGGDVPDVTKQEAYQLCVSASALGTILLRRPQLGSDLMALLSPGMADIVRRNAAAVSQMDTHLGIPS